MVERRCGLTAKLRASSDAVFFGLRAHGLLTEAKLNKILDGRTLVNGPGTCFGGLRKKGYHDFCVAMRAINETRALSAATSSSAIRSEYA